MLSACSTAVRAGGTGAEIAGLAYQFQRTRIHAVLATLWDADDEATGQLMRSFYAGLREGLPYGRALAQAQRGLIQGGAFAHPSYWAPFVLMGTP